MLDEQEDRRIPQHSLFDQLARVDVDEVERLVPDEEIDGLRATNDVGLIAAR